MIDLKTRFEQSCAGEPGHPAANERVHAGKKALRRRRTTVVGGLTLAAAVVAIVGVTAAGTPRTPSEGPAPTPDVAHAPSPTVEELIYKACVTAQPEPFKLSGGKPELMAWHGTKERPFAIFRSADRKYAFECSVKNAKAQKRLPDGTIKSTLEAGGVPYRVMSSGRGSEYNQGYCFPSDRACGPGKKPPGHWSWKLADYVGPRVAAVEAATVDGRRVRVRTNRGFFAITVSGEAASSDDDMMKSMTFYDKAGKKLGTAPKVGGKVGLVPGFPSWLEPCMDCY